MATIEQETKNKSTPYIILMTEILIFYAAAGWLFGVWDYNYPHETKLHFTVSLFYVFGVLTFPFFAVLLPSPIVRQPFIRVTAIFIITALPCLFFSQALTDALQLDRLDGNYLNALAEAWNSRFIFIAPLIAPPIQSLGFMAALALRKLLRPVNLRRIKPYLTFTDES